MFDMGGIYCVGMDSCLSLLPPVFVASPSHLPGPNNADIDQHNASIGYNWYETEMGTYIVVMELVVVAHFFQGA